MEIIEPVDMYDNKKPIVPQHYKNNIIYILSRCCPNDLERLKAGQYININDEKSCKIVRAIYNMKNILSEKRGHPIPLYEAIDNINVDTFKNLGIL